MHLYIIATIIQKHDEVYGNNTEMNQLELLLATLKAFLVIMFRLNLIEK